MERKVVLVLGGKKNEELFFIDLLPLQKGRRDKKSVLLIGRAVGKSSVW